MPADAGCCWAFTYSILLSNIFYSRGFLPASLVRLRSTTCGFAASRGFAAAPAALPALPARGPLLSRPGPIHTGAEDGRAAAA